MLRALPLVILALTSLATAADPLPVSIKGRIISDGRQKNLPVIETDSQKRLCLVGADHVSFHLHDEVVLAGFIERSDPTANLAQYRKRSEQEAARLGTTEVPQTPQVFGLSLVETDCFRLKSVVRRTGR